MRHHARRRRPGRAQRAAHPSAWKHFPFALAGARATVARAPDFTLALVWLVLDGLPRTLADTSPVWLVVPDFVLDGGDGTIEGVACTPIARSAKRIRDRWRETLVHEPGGCDGRPPNLVIVRLRQ